MRLARDPNLSVVIAGRNKETAAKTAQALSAAEGTGAEVTAQGLDAHFVTAADLSQHAIDIVINASGPFQEQNYSLARSAIKAGSHYIDLADARNFVNGIGVLDGEAKSAGVLTVSGASSVPGAVVRRRLRLSQHFRKTAKNYHRDIARQSFRSGLGHNKKRAVRHWQTICRPYERLCHDTLWLAGHGTRGATGNRPPSVWQC